MSEYIRLSSLNLSGIYQGETCTKPWQPTIHDKKFTLFKKHLQIHIFMHFIPNTKHTLEGNFLTQQTAFETWVRLGSGLLCLCLITLVLGPVCVCTWSSELCLESTDIWSGEHRVDKFVATLMVLQSCFVQIETSSVTKPQWLHSSLGPIPTNLLTTPQIWTSFLNKSCLRTISTLYTSNTFKFKYNAVGYESRTSLVLKWWIVVWLSNSFKWHLNTVRKTAPIFISQYTRLINLQLMFFKNYSWKSRFKCFWYLGIWYSNSHRNVLLSWSRINLEINYLLELMGGQPKQDWANI